MAEQPYSESLEATEKLGAAGATHPRVTINDIRASIGSVRYFILGEALNAPAGDPTHVMTMCVITTWSGFIVYGDSAPMSPENFDAVKGQTFAYENAFRKLWPLHAFARLEHGASL